MNMAANAISSAGSIKFISKRGKPKNNTLKLIYYFKFKVNEKDGMHIALLYYMELDTLRVDLKGSSPQARIPPSVTCRSK